MIVGMQCDVRRQIGLPPIVLQRAARYHRRATWNLRFFSKLQLPSSSFELDISREMGLVAFPHTPSRKVEQMDGCSRYFEWIFLIARDLEMPSGSPDILDQSSAPPPASSLFFF